MGFSGVVLGWFRGTVKGLKWKGTGERDERKCAVQKGAWRHAQKKAVLVGPSEV